MADDYRIPISADVSEVTEGFEVVYHTAEALAEQIEASFEAAGAVIHDFADTVESSAASAEQAAAAYQEWREATGLAVEGNAELVTSAQAVIEEMNGVADAARAAAESVAASAEEEAAAMEAAAAESAEASEATAAGFQKAGQGVTMLGRALLPLIGISMGASAFKSATDSMMEFGDSVRTTEAELNVSADGARAFNLALSSLGAQSGQVATAIRRLEQDASNGGKNLARLGVSTTDASGAAKSGIEIFTEVADKINNLADVNQKAEAATTLLGRSGLQLLGVLGQIGPRLQEYNNAQANSGDTNEKAAEQALALHKALTDLKAAWDDAIINIAPAVSSALENIAIGLKQDGDNAQAAVAGLNAFDAALRNALATAAQWANSGVTALMNPDSSQLPDAGDGYGDSAGAVAGDGTRQAYSPDAEAHGGGGGAWAPPAKKGKKGGGGGGGGGDWTGMEDQADNADQTIAKLTAEFNRMGTEAQMAAKEGGQSFDQLKAQATTDYQAMQAAYNTFQNAVQSGSKDAAKQAENAWHEAAQKFQTDWHLAQEKATQDMQKVKQTADEISSEISGVLNNAISGKLNWQQEFDSILEKMLSSLIKHLTQQVAMWAANEASVNSIKAAGAATGLATQKAADNAAGSSSAVTAAKGAYASAAQIPYIGWIIAPIAGAAAFAGVEAFGSAEGGYDIPPGVNPLTQLHENEMVLPANLAQGVRQMSGGGGGGGGHTINMTSNISALDSKDVGQILGSQHRAIGQALGKYVRGGGRVNKG